MEAVASEVKGYPQLHREMEAGGSEVRLSVHSYMGVGGSISKKEGEWEA